MKPLTRLAIILNLAFWVPAPLALASLALAQPVLESPQQAASTVMVQNVSLHDGMVSGVVVNKSAHVLRDVRLLVRCTWIWKSERHPGANDPGRADFYTVPAEVPANGTTAFTFQPKPPLPKRSDGEFVPLVEVVGYTEVSA